MRATLAWLLVTSMAPVVWLMHWCLVGLQRLADAIDRPATNDAVLWMMQLQNADIHRPWSADVTAAEQDEQVVNDATCFVRMVRAEPSRGAQLLELFAGPYERHCLTCLFEAVDRVEARNDPTSPLGETRRGSDA